MSKIERFSLYCSELVPDEKGDVVRFSDYERLQAELAECERREQSLISSEQRAVLALAEWKDSAINGSNAPFLREQNTALERRVCETEIQLKETEDKVLYWLKELSQIAELVNAAEEEDTLSAVKRYVSDTRERIAELGKALEAYAEQWSHHWEPGMPILEPLSDKALTTSDRTHEEVINSYLLEVFGEPVATVFSGAISNGCGSWFMHIHSDYPIPEGTELYAKVKS